MTNGPFSVTAGPPNPPPWPPGVEQPAPNGLGSCACAPPAPWPPACAAPAGARCSAVVVAVEEEAVDGSAVVACAAPDPRPPGVGGAAGAGCTRKSQHADWMPVALLFASAVPEISRISRPAASAIFSLTSPTCFLLIHAITAACGGFSP